MGLLVPDALAELRGEALHGGHPEELHAGDLVEVSGEQVLLDHEVQLVVHLPGAQGLRELRREGKIRDGRAGLPPAITGRRVLGLGLPSGSGLQEALWLREELGSESGGAVVDVAGLVRDDGAPSSVQEAQAEALVVAPAITGGERK